jgi:hypothetical protein
MMLGPMSVVPGSGRGGGGVEIVKAYINNVIFMAIP